MLQANKLGLGYTESAKADSEQDTQTVASPRKGSKLTFDTMIQNQ